MKITCSKCDAFLELSRLGKQRYCMPCHAEHMRLTRPKHCELPPVPRMKANARSYANVYKKRGVLNRRPCEQCGNELSQFHHEDYSKPLEVKHLCRPCHLELHRMKNCEEAVLSELGDKTNTNAA